MYAALVEVIEHAHQVAQAAGQSVEFPDNQRVPILQRFEATEQGRALSGGSCALVLKSFLTSGFLQGRELQGGILVLGRDAGVTVFHASNLKHQSPLITGLPAVFHNLPFLKQMEDRPGMSPSFALLCYRNRDTPMQYKNQHTVPQSYLSVWCDHETPAGQTPYVWVWTKDGNSARRKAPLNIFRETDIYTLKLPDGSRDVTLEQMFSKMEQEFAALRGDKLERRVALSRVEWANLVTFVAALHVRSAAQLRHLQSERNRVVKLAERIAEQATRATAEQRKAMAMLAPPPSTPSWSLEEFRALAAEPQRTLRDYILAETAVMLRMNLALFEAPAGYAFITSDVPVTWFDPDLYKRPPAYQSLGLAYPNVEVRMPVSPRLILNISHHTELGGRRFIATGQM